MAYGKGMVTSGEMNAHKSMAGAGSSGNFGVKSAFSAGHQTQPGVKSFEAMNDGSRAAKPGIPRAGGHAMQAAADHGDMGKDHFTRGPKY